MSSIPLPERHDHPRFAWLRVGRPEKHAPGTTSTVLLSMNLAGIGKVAPGCAQPPAWLGTWVGGAARHHWRRAMEARSSHVAEHT